MHFVLLSVSWTPLEIGGLTFYHTENTMCSPALCSPIWSQGGARARLSIPCSGSSPQVKLWAPCVTWIKAFYIKVKVILLSTFTLSFSWQGRLWRCKSNGICRFNVIDFHPLISVSTGPWGVCSVSSELSILWRTSFVNQSQLHKANPKGSGFFKPQNYIFKWIIPTNAQTCSLYWPTPKPNNRFFTPESVT